MSPASFRKEVIQCLIVIIRGLNRAGSSLQRGSASDRTSVRQCQRDRNGAAARLPLFTLAGEAARTDDVAEFESFATAERSLPYRALCEHGRHGLPSGNAALYSNRSMEQRRFAITRVQGAPVTTDELLADLRRVGEAIDGSLTQRHYTENGRYNVSTIERRFGSWGNAVQQAGFEAGNTVNYPDDALFENIMRLWEHFGRQPRRAELAHPPSTITQSPYRRRFRSWMDALEAFVTHANASEASAPIVFGQDIERRGSRDASLRMRFRVLKRDDFKCRACGASPSMSPGLHLHVDHVKPWSAGGETIDANLQTLCEHCNLGKSNVL